jgi:hypothetical protein
MLDSALPASTAGDIKGGIVGNWLVTGWFTPDYRPLAERFAFNLSEHAAPFHLWAMPSAGAWNTMRKPSVVLETLDAYPGKTVVLMDVDCIIHGDIAPVANATGDVGITILARNMRKRETWQHWIAAEASSRVVVFRPTDGARTFARRWAERIESSNLSHDEHSMVWAFLACPDVRFDYIDVRYSGREVGQLPGAVIEHQSAYSGQKKDARGGIRKALRSIERRFFRTGRTARDKTALSALVKGL